MNEAININYIDETEYPRVAVMCGRCLNIVANMWNASSARLRLLRGRLSIMIRQERKYFYD